MGKGYEKRCKVTRIFLADYLLLKAMSEKAGVSMAEALHEIITGQDLKSQANKAAVQAGQMSIFRVMPVTSVVAVNGSKLAAFGIKPKGGVIHG